ncbi:MAG: hypothetical protein DIJKHBIC_04765 [Thermoanaerobaculia bacterium]|nr:hypothetical protein [Thermoanaerobaculia bacterium]
MNARSAIACKRRPSSIPESVTPASYRPAGAAGFPIRVACSWFGLENEFVKTAGTSVPASAPWKSVKSCMPAVKPLPDSVTVPVSQRLKKLGANAVPPNGVPDVVKVFVDDVAATAEPHTGTATTFQKYVTPGDTGTANEFCGASTTS